MSTILATFDVDELIHGKREKAIRVITEPADQAERHWPTMIELGPIATFTIEQAREFGLSLLRAAEIAAAHDRPFEAPCGHWAHSGCDCEARE